MAKANGETLEYLKSIVAREIMDCFLYQEIRSVVDKLTDKEMEFGFSCQGGFIDIEIASVNEEDDLFANLEITVDDGLKLNGWGTDDLDGLLEEIEEELRYEWDM